MEVLNMSDPVVRLPLKLREELEEIRDQQRVLNERMVSVDHVMDLLTGGVGKMNHRQEQLEGRVSNVEREVETLKRETRDRFNLVRSRFSALSPTIDRLLDEG